MTRAFTPPETMSKQDIRTVADVRRDIWTSAFWGMGVGSFSGLALHSAAQIASRRGILPKGMNTSSLNRNTALLSFLAGGAFGSFLMATTTGKNQMHRLHPIFQVGSQQQAEQAYEQSLARARQRESDLEQREHDRWTRRAVRQQTDEDERALRRQNRILRRRTLQDNLQHGRGQTDSHGGRWAPEDERFQGQQVVLVDPDEERAMRQKNRMLRRKTLQDTFERGHGPSDAHGGRWVDGGSSS